jgi:hypothetical protein
MIEWPLYAKKISTARPTTIPIRDKTPIMNASTVAIFEKQR